VTVDRGILLLRILRVRQELRHLDRLRSLSLEEYLASTLERYATERQITIVIETCLDIGHHVIAREGRRRPTDYGDVLSCLGENGVVDLELATVCEPWPDFRNILTQMYLELDQTRVLRFAREDVPTSNHPSV